MSAGVLRPGGPRGGARRAWLVLAGACLMGAVAGCSSSPPPPVAGVREDQPPAYAEIARAWNQRVDGLDRLWARATVRVEGQDAEGTRLREQAEGHLQIEQPRRLSLSLGKVGEMYLHLGSDDERYWWLDALDGDASVGLVGRHELVSAEKAAGLGLPVHPLDLIELLGITPLPTEGRAVGWNRDRTLAVFAVPARWGVRYVWVNPGTLEPVRIALADADQTVLAEAELSHLEIVRIEGDATRQPRVPTRVVVRQPGFDGFVRISMYDPRNRGIPGVAFDLPALVRRYGIDTVVDVDSEEGRAWVAGRGG